MMKVTLLPCCVLVATIVATTGMTLTARSQDPTAQTALPVTPVLAPPVSAPSPPATTPAPPPVPPQQYLEDARQLLDGLAEGSLASDAQKQLAHLRADFSTLASKYGDAQEGNTTWESAFYDVERDIVRLIGGRGLPGTSADEQEATPTSRSEVVNAPMRARLSAFRTQVELFYDATTR
jgi:hypothetical protein